MYDRLFLITRYDSFVETNEFNIPGSEVIVKLRPANNMSHTGSLAAQFVLVEPRDDIIKVFVEGGSRSQSNERLLRNEISLVFVEKKVETKLPRPTTCCLPFIITCKSQWKHEFLNLDPSDPADVTIIVDGQRIPTTEAILTSKSDVFAAMFAHDTKEKQTRTVEIKDFSFEVVQEMIRFMMHNYCTLWDGQMEALTSIAEKYNIADMKKLAHEKHLLLVEHAEASSDSYPTADHGRG